MFEVVCSKLMKKDFGLRIMDNGLRICFRPQTSDLIYDYRLHD